MYYFCISMGKDSTIKVINLGVSFETATGVVQAAKEISFQLAPGRTLGVVGESGSGKSATALALMRLLPVKNCRLEGEWYLDDGEAGSLPIHALPDSAMEHIRGRRAGMIFQDPMSSLNPVFRCGDQVLEVVRLHLGLRGASAEAHVLDWFEKVKLPDPHRIYSAYPHQLSGGQKQRVMIAMAMCCSPALLIADEPTTALDVTVQQTILELIRALQQETGTACLFISHDLGVISEIADEVAVMQRGRIVEYGTTKQILESPNHPYTRGLIACRPPLEHRLHRLPVANREGNVQSVQIRTRPEELSRVELLMAQKPLLEVRHLEVTYPGKPPVHAVSDISFSVFPGETLGLVGESGSGKTTLGRALLGLVSAQRGEVIYSDRDLMRLSPAAWRPLRPRLQMIFQDPYDALNPRLSIGEAIAEVLAWHGLCHDAGECRVRVLALLDTVGLDAEYFGRFPRELSGGQRQRACIARALATEPDLLICDESVSALDVSVQAQVLNLLQDIQQARSLTMMFISHDLSVIRQISDRMLVMEHGRMREIGATATICANPQTEYTLKLLKAIPGQKQTFDTAG
jgi:peptide/nickel transport system ATP-binding protein